MSPEVSNPWHDAYQRSRGDVPQLAWLAGLREAAMAVVAAHGLPDTTDEDWRYTNLAAYARRSSDYLSGGSPAIAPASSPADPVLADARYLHLTLRDGILELPGPALPAGLTVDSLRNSDPVLRASAEALLAIGRPGSPLPLVALNTAFLRDGVLLRTGQGATVAMPLHIALVASGQPLMAQPRLLIDLAAGSSLTVILEHTGRAGALANVVSQIHCGAGARLELIRVQDLPDDGFLTETTQIELQKDAVLTVTSVDLGGQLSRQELAITLAGRGAQATVYGAFLADGSRHIDNHTRVEHRAPDTTSRESFRGIADERGRAVFNGKIIVRPGAVRTDAALSNRNLLLASTAEIDTKPELEIDTDDVRCSHGATTGQLDANAVFYLRARGLDLREARQVLTTAFLREALDAITAPGLRASIDERLRGRLARLGEAESP